MRADLLQRPRVEIIWHPSQEKWEEFAEALYANLSFDPKQPLENKPGLPVRFWSDLDHIRKNIGVEAAWKGRVAVVVLIDDAMLEDSEWENWLMALAQMALEDYERMRVVPIVESSQRYANVQLLGQMNFIEKDTNAVSPDNQSQYLLNHVLISLLNFIESDRLHYEVFLNYVRGEGTKLRDELVRNFEAYSYLRPFYDERDLIAGAPYRVRFQNVIKSSAFLAIRTDSYSSRIETLREFEFAKREGRPIVVLDALEKGEARSFPYLGNCPILRASDSLDLHKVINILLTEIFRFELLRLELRTLKEETDNTQYSKRLIVTYQTPDLLSVSHQIFCRGKDSEVESPRNFSAYIYPDPPVTYPELAILQRVNEKFVFLTPVQLKAMGISPYKTLEKLAGQPEFEIGQEPLRGLTVQISASNPLDSDLKDIGRRKIHTEESIIEFGRYLIAAGANIVFGGYFGSGSVGEWLLRILKIYGHSESPQTPRIRAYLPYPVGAAISSAEKKQLGSLMYFTCLHPPQDVNADTQNGQMMPAEEQSLPSKYVWTRCLTEARRTITKSVNAIILIGGKEIGYKGRYPGLVEESLFAIEEGKPLYLVGCMGGCARSIFSTVAQESGWSLAEAFNEELQKSQDKEFWSYYNERVAKEDLEDLSIDYERLKNVFYDHGLNSKSICCNGLSHSENITLGHTMFLEESISLAIKGLTHVNKDLKTDQQ